MEVSKSNHIISLSKEIIDDIELSRIEGQTLLLKATRLARYVDDEEIRKWLRYEMQGFNDEDVALKYMAKTDRWIDKEKGEGNRAPLAKVQAWSDAMKQKLSVIRIPDTGGDNATRVMNSVMSHLNHSTQSVAKLEGIKARVTSLIHDFATNVYYQKTFDSVAESIFDNYKKDIDLLIAENSGDVLEQIPSVIGRLSDGDKESISQALTTCRRIIDSFANHIYPASDDVITIGGNTLSLKPNNVLNRINAFIHLNSDSDSQKKKLRQNLTNLYERVSAGVHSDVDVNEAKSLFFNTYLLLGEILMLKKG